MSASRSPPSGAGRSAAITGLVVLTGLNLLNYFDRFIVSAVLPTLKSARGLSLTGTQAGWLASAFMIVYTITAPIFGVIGDRGSRTKCIAAGVLVWSVATALGGLATSFAVLIVARSVVGIGEAAYAPQAPPMLSDWFAKERRARVFAVFYAAFPIGTALGVVFGSAIDAHLSWRVAFFLAGAPGVALGLLASRLRPAPTGANDRDLAAASGPGGAAVGGAAAPATWETVRTSLLRNPTYLVTVLGYAAYSAVFGAFLFWMPSFLVSVHHLDSQAAGFRFGIVVAVAGIGGTLAGGAGGDLLFRRTKQGYLWLSAATTLAASGVLVVVLRVEDTTAALAAVAVFAFLLYTVTGPVNGALVNALPPSVRATGLAVNVFAIHALGDAWSPLVVGHLSDQVHSLRDAMTTVLPGAMLAGSVLWIAAALVDRARERALPASAVLGAA